MTLRLWGSEAVVSTNTDPYVALELPKVSVTALQNGGYVVAWTKVAGFSSSVIHQRYDAFGNKVGSEVSLIATSSPQSEPHIATLSNGNYIIAYKVVDDFAVFEPDIPDPDNPNLIAQAELVGLAVYAPNGVLIQNEIIPSTDLYYNVAGGLAGIYISNPQVSVTNGGFEITFVHNKHQIPFVTTTTIHSVTFNNNNSLIPSNTDKDYYRTSFPDGLQNDTGLGGSSVAGDAFVFTDASGVYVDNGYSTIGGLVAAMGGGISATSSKIAKVGLNDYIVTWTQWGTNSSEPNIYASRVIYDGTNISVNGFVQTIVGQNSEIFSFADGSFVILWDAPVNGGAPADREIKMQMWDSSQNPVGATIVVNSTSAATDQTPVVTKLADGRLVVVWQDSSATAGPGGAAVMQQIIDPREGIVDGTNIASLAETLVGNNSLNDLIRGYAGDDTIYGLNGSDVMYGGDGNDVINGGNGDDVAYGGNGNDTIIGGRGADDIYGDAGTDTISFRQSTSGVDVNLITGIGLNGEADGDTYTSVEGFLGSNHNDVFVGSNALTARIEGFSGDDNLTGGSGADTFVGGAGADTINGLGGTDRANYSASTAVTINLVTNANTGGEAQGDILTNIEEVSGSAFADTITGNTLKNHLLGQSGADRLDGGVGADTLTGGGGSDSFVFNLNQSGTTSTTHDFIADYAKGAVGTGDEIDFATALTIGGAATAATATQASINATTGFATFAAGSGTTLADALSDVSNSINVGGTTAGEFAFFLINNTSAIHMFISDGVAGIGAGDVLVRMTGVTSVGSISIDAGDVTILT